MKSVAAWSLLLWLSLLLEQAPANPLMMRFASGGAIIVPVAVGCVFWFRSGGGILLAGVALLMHWLLTSTGFPLNVVVVPLLCAWLLTSAAARQQSFGRRWHWKHWLQPCVMVLLGICCMAAHFADDAGSAVRWVASRMMTALPLVLLILAVLRIRAEFEVRRA